MSQPELNALIVANIQDLDGAAYHFENVLQPEVGNALDEAARRFCKHAGWAGAFDFDDSELWVAPSAWTKTAEQEAYPPQRFNFTHDDDDRGDLDYFWLTQLVGKGRARLGFAWTRWGVDVRRWKKALAAQASLIEQAGKLGYTYQERRGRFFLPVSVDSEVLSQSLADGAIEQGLEPFAMALAKLKKDQAFFDRVVTTVQLD